MANGDLQSQVEVALHELRKFADDPSFTWEDTFLPTPGSDCNLLWRYAMWACRPDAMSDAKLLECQALILKFLEEDVLDRIRANFPRHIPMYLGQIYVIVAAFAERLGSEKADVYLGAAASEYADSFSPLADARVSRTGELERPSPSTPIANPQAIAAFALSRVLGTAAEPVSCRTWFLLDGHTSQAIRLLAELHDGEGVQLVPDATRIGPVVFDGDFLDSISAAWACATSLPPAIPMGSRVVWGFQEHFSVKDIRGASGGAAFAALFRAAIAGESLSEHVAVSATIGPDCRLGEVAKTSCTPKQIAAGGAGCDEVIFHKGNNRAATGTSPQAEYVDTFDKVWDRLSRDERALRAYREHYRINFEKQWSNVAEWPK